MPDKKLTDSEIVKALEDLVKCNNNEIDCDNCSLSVFYPRCPEEIGELSLDLINRLQEKDKTRHKVFETKCEELEIAKAENERLKIENAKLRGYKTNDWLIRGISPEQLEQEKIQVWKAEAYKEFAEKMEERIAVKLLRNKSNEYVEGFVDALDGVNGEIDNLLKELVGGGGCDTCKSLTCDGCELYEELVGEDNAEEKE